jgi:phosphoserine aminotransferase
MNVTFRLPTQELEGHFLTASIAAEIVGLQGHRTAGGLRASLYNAVGLDSVQALVAFMADFQQRWG